MAITLADTYYLKALDNYPYNLPEAIENVNYALSYDDAHSGGHCLMARINFYQLKNYELAEYHFQSALASNINDKDTHEYYVYFLLAKRDFRAAKKLVSFSKKRGVLSVAKILQVEALLNEYQKEYDVSLKLLNKALDESYNEGFTDFIKSEINRVEDKIKRRKANKKKK
ncbi:MAG: hypothetical protein ACKOXB_02565 [Flavobacteriales bacterium]